MIKAESQMNIDDVFKTRTMARILTNQGKLKKAAEIYEHLIKNDPHNKELTEDHNNLKKMMDSEYNLIAKNLMPLYRKWINLKIKYYKGFKGLSIKD